MVTFLSLGMRHILSPEMTTRDKVKKDRLIVYIAAFLPVYHGLPDSGNGIFGKKTKNIGKNCRYTTIDCHIVQRDNRRLRIAVTNGWVY